MAQGTFGAESVRLTFDSQPLDYEMNNIWY